MFSKKSVFIFLLIFWGGLLISSPVYARGLVPCGGTNEQPCTVCHAFQLGQNVLFVIAEQVVPAAGIILVVVAGIFMFLGGAKPDMFQKGKTMLKDTAIGAAIFYGAWAIVNTLVILVGQNLAGPGSTFSSNWTNFTCTAQEVDFYKPPPGLYYSCNASNLCETNTTCKLGDPNCYDNRFCGGKCGGQLPSTCSDEQGLAQSHNVPLTPTRDPRLQSLLNCIESKLGPMPAEGGVNSFYGSVFTWDHDHRICNFTRGERTCGTCSHAVYSCHYGGERTGTQGALGVDFGTERNRSSIRNAAIECGANSAKIYDEGDHLHISHPSCDKN
ncbi:MAG: TrbC/VirB2 family protein [Parcubacteria group bacterium]|nr:TrbC/VirB2 family protein [Parcubacteria group bacterium]